MNDNAFIVSAAGVRMPRLIYGTAWKADRTAALVEQALSMGFHGVDTACQPKHYHEPGVGAGLQAAFAAGLERDAVYVQTKFTPTNGQDPAQTPYDPRASLMEQVAQSFAASLKNLGTGHVDGLVLHSPLANEAQLMEVWRAMEVVHDAGGARQLGISNCYSPALLERLHGLARIKPAVVQNRFYAETGYDREIRDFCRRHGVIYQSFWTLTANPRVLEHPTVQQLATKYGRTAAQVFFRYLTQDGIVPLTGTTSAAHMREDLAIFEFQLAADERAAIGRLLG